jgi:hypothetical protein
MRFGRHRVQDYIERNRIQGWLHPFSGQAIAALSTYQVDSGLRGAVAEIGVHHGKLFFVLYLTTMSDEAAIAIDVFAAQYLNLDKSGRGDKSVFLNHARRLSPKLDGLKIIEDSSLNIMPDQIMAEGGAVRLFSIDGAHTEEATINDIKLAESSIAEHGIVVLDDVFNEMWPEVSGALSKYLTNSPVLSPFAITPGKVLMARQPFSRKYGQFLQSAFPKRVDKHARLYGHDVPIIGVMPWTIKRRLGRTKVGQFAKRIIGKN